MFSSIIQLPIKNKCFNFPRVLYVNQFLIYLLSKTPQTPIDSI